MCRRIGEYISLELLSAVTSKVSSFLFVFLFVEWLQNISVGTKARVTAHHNSVLGRLVLFLSITLVLSLY